MTTAPRPTQRLLTVESVSGLATIQATPREGFLWAGFPPSGPLAPRAMGWTNSLLGNDAWAEAIELCGVMRVRASTPITLATTDAGVITLAANESVTIGSHPHRVTYVAAPRGFVANIIARSASTHATGGIGTMITRGAELLVRGVPAGGSSIPPAATRTPSHLPSAGASLTARIRPGPDHESFRGEAKEVLLATTWTIAPTSNRVGTRLTGSRLPRTDDDSSRSTPMCLGAIQVPAGGEPIVLGPDHPVTGGYPVIAVVMPIDLEVLHRASPGTPLRFVDLSAPVRAGI